MRFITTLLKENIGFLMLMLLLFACRSSFADWYHVPTGSMQPTILEGDRVFVDKAAFRLDLPFTDIGIMETGLPERGDIVTIQSSAADERLIKRVIGLPGDVVSMNQNQLFINGQPQQLTETADGLTESIDGKVHALRLTGKRTRFDTFPPVTVPKGHYLVLGDNRDRSADSRYYGFVPLNEITGKATHIIASLNPDNYYLPRDKRFLKALK